MPLLTRLFIKTSLLCLIAALCCGLLLALRPMLAMPLLVAGLTPIYFHLLMVGWVTQIIMGVAYWMFPKRSKARPRGSSLLGWSAYALLNAGLLLRVVAEPAQMVQARQIWGWLLAASALLQCLGGFAFVINTWPRIKVR